SPYFHFLSNNRLKPFHAVLVCFHRFIYTGIFFHLVIPRRRISTLFPYTTLFRSARRAKTSASAAGPGWWSSMARSSPWGAISFSDRKSTRLNSSHVAISYAVFCLKKKTTTYLERTLMSLLGVSAG